ncbi:MAG: hypothetical protein ACFE7E_05070 [Candidatus Hodarchaeota archaeon]
MRKAIGFSLVLTFFLSMGLLMPAFVPAMRSNTLIHGSGEPGYELFEGMTEMLPGVFVTYEWINQSGSHSEYHKEYCDGYWIEDNLGNHYVIKENATWSWNMTWDFKSFYVGLFADSDESLMNWLMAEYPELESGFEETGNNGIGLACEEEEQEEAMSDDNLLAHLSGDEALTFSYFYYVFVTYNFSSSIEYTWYNKSVDPPVEVDPLTVIPNLNLEEFWWAEEMTGSYSENGNGTACEVGFDIEQWALLNLRISELDTDIRLTWMKHYFAGMTVFNDTNDNGLMDLTFKETEEGLDEVTSEVMYGFVLDSAEIGQVVVPHVVNNAIEWSVEITDLNGSLISYWGNPLAHEYGILDYAELTDIPVIVDSLKFTYHFTVEEDKATMKIDQFVGEFKNQTTGEILAEVDGLGLALSYWSAFLKLDYSATFIDEIEEAKTSESEISDEVEGGALFFNVDGENFAEVYFGGTYVWGKDSNTYDVGTVVIPKHLYYLVFEVIDFTEQEGTLSGFATRCEYAEAVVFFSSCYSNWSGYSITHDPTFVAYFGGVAGIASIFIVGSVLLALGVVGALLVVEMRRRGAKPQVEVQSAEIS